VSCPHALRVRPGFQRLEGSWSSNARQRRMMETRRRNVPAASYCSAAPVAQGLTAHLLAAGSSSSVFTRDDQPGSACHRRLRRLPAGTCVCAALPLAGPRMRATAHGTMCSTQYGTMRRTPCREHTGFSRGDASRMRPQKHMAFGIVAPRRINIGAKKLHARSISEEWSL